MELTGKCKQDFEKWLISFFREKRTDYNNLFTDESILRKFYRKTDVEKNTLIIEFFDSIGIYIETWHYDGFCWQIDCNLLDESPKYNEALKSRQEAKNEAIKKANLIYNEKHKNTMKIIAKIELSNVDRWKIDFDNDYEKKEAFDKLEYEMKQAISEKCVIDCENISIELKLEK